ncbi:VOC family protein [Ciceribacter sp. L1K22]|uniref:VOC family protein n=1 Tax=Ciceribacter sp. L1K22 TaxID=2820275 RepID=UPI001ABDE838|nr:VOC family protein [Ciceribacter sp. L1K22]MBO3758653.1 VOC family protein [Ciceribacter sp. L1K22]
MTETTPRFESGIHHVTLITRKVQANVDFYVGFLGLRIVKRTGGFEDAEQLHLIYGDRTGSPGTLITFLVWEDGAPGRVGNGQVSEVSFAVPQDTIGEWLTRALDHRVTVEGPMREFGETVLRLKDPDGVIVKLVGVASPPSEGHRMAPIRLRGVTILSDAAEETAAFITRFGYRPGPMNGALQRMVSETDIVDVRDATGYVPGIPGTGTADHVAFRVADVDAVRQAEAELKKRNSSVINVHDRKYFYSLYVREPGGTLIELATDGPGFLVDEDEATLGETLFVPPDDIERAEDIRVLLPQFAMPGEPRMPVRDLPFVHRFFVPEQPGEETIVLLHGSGGSEADLMPLGHRIAPDATLLGVRGRATEEGIARWFRRFSTVSFDQADIVSEAEAFAAFVEGAIAGYRLDPGSLTFLGLSNGANFIAAVMALHPRLIRRAVLIRGVTVLDDMPDVDLKGVEVLMVTGRDDPFADRAGPLAAWFLRCGASLTHRQIEAGHGLSPEDIPTVRAWLDGAR